MKRSLLLVFVAVLASGLIGACSGGEDEAASVEGGDVGISDGGGGGERFAEGDAPHTVAEDSIGTTQYDETSELPAVGPSVIKTADIRVAVPKDDFRESIQDGVAVAQRHGGFVNSTTVDDENHSGSMTIRVPAEQFEAALGDLKQLGDVESETISGIDVSQEFVDLEARLRNLEAQETVLLDLMEEADSVVATIRVQRELQPVQLEIERLTGRINYLQDQTDMSTINVTFGPAAAAPAKPAGALQRAWENAKDTTVAVLSAIVLGAGFVLPIAVLLALVALAVRWLRPRFSAQG